MGDGVESRCVLRRDGAVLLALAALLGAFAAIRLSAAYPEFGAGLAESSAVE
jgi:hypothetical protein